MGMHLATRARDLCLETIKRPAIRALHATRRGEAALLGIYLMGEEHAEEAVLLDAIALDAPPWLSRWLEKQRADEARHARMFRERLRALTGAEPRSAATIDPVSRWKLDRLRKLASQFASRFRHGLLVPLLAIAWRMEQMGVRVFTRHIDVLDVPGADHPTLTLLRKVVTDEKGHVAAVERALTRLTTAPEWNDLQLLVLKIDRIERAFGVLGAVILLGLGVVWAVLPRSFDVQPRPAEMTTEHRDHAA